MAKKKKAIKKKTKTPKAKRVLKKARKSTTKKVAAKATRKRKRKPVQLPLPDPAKALPTGGPEVALAEYPDLAGSGFAELCSEYRALHVQMKTLDMRKKELGDLIKPLMEAVEADSVVGDGWHAIYSHGQRTTLHKEKLVEHGVSLEQIEESSTTSRYTYIQIRERAEKVPL